MNVKIHSRHLQASRGLEDLVRRKSSKVRKVLPSFSAQDLDLNVSLEKLPRGRQFRTSLVLTLPQAVIRVEDIKENLTTSVVRAFDDLLRRLERFKSQLNRQKLWQKAPQQIEPRLSESNADGIEQMIGSHLDRVENYVRRELFHRALIDYFPPGVLQPQALVDQVFLEATSRVSTRPEGVPLEQWVFSVARETVEKNVARIEAVREESHLEEPSESPARWEDEVLNFYQPDESLKLEDLLTDESSVTPEEWLAREETEERIQKALASLPRRIRESFVLFALEGFNVDEVAMITGKGKPDVLQDVEEARNQLRTLISP